MRRRTPSRRPSKQQQPLGPVQTFDVSALTHEAKGVARLNGKVTFIDGALPGEVVEARVSKAGRRYDEALLVSILEPSPNRVAPRCAHFDKCGGCSFQHLDHEHQIEAKSTWLAGQLRHVVQDDAVEELVDVPYQYRRRARIALQHNSGQLVMGFRGKSSNNIISIDQCSVLTEKLQSVFAALKLGLSKDSLAEKLGHIELLDDDKGASVLFRLTQVASEEELSNWKVWAEQQDIVIYWQDPNESKARVEESQLRHYQLDELNFLYHPQDFIQVNKVMNDKMVEQAMAWLQPNENDVILDLFCGVGNFSLPLAKRAKQVLGIEVQETMVEAGRKNAHLNQLDKVTFLAADLTQPVSTDLTRMGVTKVLLDPPRAGAFEFLESIIKIKPAQILYVSCNASTLARDAEFLVAKGYQVLRVSLMDMFPQTSHVETMMLLQKKK